MNEEDSKPILDPKSGFELPPEQMREFGYRVVDLVVDHFENIRKKSPVTKASRQEMDWLLHESIPELGMPLEQLLDHVETNILGNSADLAHPMWYAFCPSPNNIVSTFADTLATGFNVFSGAWVSSPGAAELEILTTNWLLKLFGFPVVEGGGLFLSGGSMANLTAMATARQIKLGTEVHNGTVYWSNQTHSSVARAARVIGLAPEQIRVLPVDRDQRLDVQQLRNAVEQDLAVGKNPFLVVANAGTTNTGAVDSLDQIALVCRHYKLWMHVDAAFGGGGIVCPRGAAVLSGIELADSIAVDPHKWFYQPYEIGCLLVRDYSTLAGTFRTAPEYLKDLEGSAEEINFFDAGIQLTRRFRALKFYMSIKAYGLGTFRKAVERSIELAEDLEQLLANSLDWEIVTPAQLAVITFRLKPHQQDLDESKLDQLNQYVSNRIIEEQKAMLATTIVDGKTVLRMCLINPRTTLDDVTSTLATLKTYLPEWIEGSHETTPRSRFKKH